MSNLNQKGLVGYLLLIVFVVVTLPVFVFVIAGVSNENTGTSENYFIQLDSNLKKISSNVQNTMEFDIDVEHVTECHNAEQGPFDDGNLWCFVNQAYYTKVVGPDEAEFAKEELIDIFESEFSTIGFEGAIDTPLGQLLDSKGAWGACNFSTWYPAHEHVGYHLPSHYATDKEVQTVVSCGAPAADKYFEYID